MNNIGRRSRTNNIGKRSRMKNIGRSSRMNNIGRRIRITKQREQRLNKQGTRRLRHLSVTRRHGPWLFAAVEKEGLKHGPNNYTDTKHLMSSLFVFNRVYRLEIQSVMLVFSAPLVTISPANLFTGLTPPPPFPM